MNKVILIGHVGQDPRVTKFQNGGKVAQLTLATTERGYRLQNGTEVPEHTDWHNLVFNGGLTTVVEQYVRKGSQIAVEGKIRQRSFESQQQTKYITEIIVSDMTMLSAKKEQEHSPVPY